MSLKMLCSKLTVYGVIYLMIGEAIYDVLPVSYLYTHDDTDMVTFVLTAMLTKVVRSAVSGRSSKPVSVHNSLKHSFCNTHT